MKPKLRQGTFLSADSEFSIHNAQLCITGLISRELFVKPILVIGMIAVVRRDHPLLAIRRRISRSDLMQHTLVTIESTASGTLKHQPRLLAQRMRRVGKRWKGRSAARSRTRDRRSGTADCRARQMGHSTDRRPTRPQLAYPVGPRAVPARSSPECA